MIKGERGRGGREEGEEGEEGEKEGEEGEKEVVRGCKKKLHLRPRKYSHSDAVKEKIYKALKGRKRG